MSSEPSPDAVLTASPGEIRIRLSEIPAGDSTSIRVVDERGHVLPTTPTRPDERDPTVFSTAITEPLAPARYTVVWRATGSDGRRVRALFAFEVTGPTGES